MKVKKKFLLALIVLIGCALGVFFGCDKSSDTVTLTFRSNGGSVVDSLAVPPGAEVEFETPEREGYAFDGWFDNAALSGTAYRGTLNAPEKSTTYYAKWAEAKKLTLDCDGGTSAPQFLWVKPGASLLEALAGVKPQKSGLTFGAWFDGEREIIASDTMPDADYSLKAKYQVAYTVEVYLCNLSGNSYVPAEEYRSEGKWFVGQTYAPAAPDVEHYVYEETPASGTPVTSRLLSEDAAENVYRFYYARERYGVVYDANAPAGTVQGDAPWQDAAYEGLVSLAQNPFVRPGYRFAGWSETETGDVDYMAGQSVRLRSSLILYAVWDKGFTDRYGSPDLIFFPRLEEGVAVLLRGGVEFSGTRTGDHFVFTLDGGTMFEGNVYGTQYSYVRNDIADEYVFYANTIDPAVKEQYDPSRKLTIDPYLNATYSEGDARVEGAVSYDAEYGDYVFTGDATRFHFLPAHGEQFDYPAVFSVGSAEFGFYLDFVMMDFETGMGYSTSSMLLALDGYSTASLLDAQNMMQYDGRYYVADEYKIGNSDYSIYKVVLFLEDIYGTLTGGQPGTVTNFVYTVPEIGDGYGGYVSADRFYGSYEDEEGGSLVLDGFGNFENSAVYTADGVEFMGTYTVDTDLLSGSVVTITSGKTTRAFRIDPDKKTFSPPAEREGNYTEYRLMDGNSLKPPFLVLFGNGATRSAEVYMPTEDESGLILVAKGTCKVENLGDSRFNLVEFTRTWEETGYEGQISSRLVFYTTQVRSTQTLENYYVYCVLEDENGDYLEKISLADGGEVWVTSTVTAGGLGALYFTAGGEVYEGQFTRSSSQYEFEATYGTLLYATESDLVTRCFSLVSDAAGNVTAEEIDFTEAIVYVIPEEGETSSDVGLRMLFLDSTGHARYTGDRGATFRQGTYAAVDTTDFRETVYALTIGGAEEFRFTHTPITEGSSAFAYVYVQSTAGTYDAADGASLVLDGFCRALLTDADGKRAEGTYTKKGAQVTFVLEGGEEQIFTLSGTSFAPIDWAVSRTWKLLDNNYEPINDLVIVFDGEGGVNIYEAYEDQTQRRLVSSGSYRELGTVYDYWGYPEYLLRDVNFGDGYPYGNYRVTFAINTNDEGACLVQNSEALGTFLDANWNVLTLDGFGLGAYSTREFSESGSYTVVGKANPDSAQTLLAFTVDEEAASDAAGAVYYVLVDADHGAFVINDYAAIACAYFSAEMDRIVFGEDGIAYLGASSGPYYADEENAYLFLTSQPTVVPLPKGDSYVFRGKTYTRWDGKDMTLTGKIEIKDKTGAAYKGMGALDAVMTFRPDLTGTASVSAVFTINGKTYEDENFTLGFYVEDALTTTVTYGRNVYPISYHYTAAEKTFTVTGGYNSVRLLDHNARFIAGDEYTQKGDVSVPIYRGGYIDKSTVGFGPIVYETLTYSGGFYYLYDTTSKLITFEDIEEKDVLHVGNVPSYGDRMEIVFGFENTTYAIDYYEYYQGGNYYWAYGFYTVEEFETPQFRVYVKSLAYTHFSTAPGYVDYNDKSIVNHAIGQPIAATLIDKESGKAVVAYDTGYLPNGYGTGVWIVDREGIVEKGQRETCTWGKGYLVTFLRDGGAITGVEVKEYRFVQIVNYMQCLVNLFLDGDGKVLPVGIAAYNADWGRYDWLTDPGDFRENEDGSWTFAGTQGKKRAVYTVKAERGEDNEDGNETFTVTMSESSAS